MGVLSHRHSSGATSTVVGVVTQSLRPVSLGLFGHQYQFFESALIVAMFHTAGVSMVKRLSFCGM